MVAIDAMARDWFPSLREVGCDSWDAYRLMEAVQLLKALRLVSTNMLDGHTRVSMHPLLHAWARDRQSGEEPHASWLRMVYLAALSREDGELRKGNE